MIRSAVSIATTARCSSSRAASVFASSSTTGKAACSNAPQARLSSLRSISSTSSAAAATFRTNFDRITDPPQSSSPPPSTSKTATAAATPTPTPSSSSAPFSTSTSPFAPSSPPSSPPTWNPPLTKIVATIGPTSEQLPVLQDVVRGGMRVMRLNFSHATVEEVELRVKNLKLCQGRHFAAKDLPCYGTDEETGEQNVRAVLLDTRGPEIRTGKLANDASGHETVHLETGGNVTLQTSSKWAEDGSTSENLYIDYPDLHQSVKVGSKVLLDDGAITLTVASVNDADGSVNCVVDNSGELRSRAGVNLPGAETSLPAMSDKDKVDIKYGMTKDVDYVAASFVQNADGVREIRAYIRECAEELWGGDDSTDKRPLPLIISKIESVAALTNFDDILSESDGIMVARGDLGVEIPIQHVTTVQKEMVAACNAAGKPVIVATQMLESMAKNPRPTRAEVADVTNAVLDGADAVMLSGETAKGKYPVETIETMNEIIAAAEQFVGRKTDPMGARALMGGGPPMSRFGAANGHEPNNPEATIAKSAVTAAIERHATAILVITKHGTLPRLVSAYRPNVPIVAFCPNGKVARQLILNHGIHPVIGLGGVPMAKRPVRAIRHAKAMGFVKPGDDVVVVTMEADQDMGTIGTMKVATVSGDETS